MPCPFRSARPPDSARLRSKIGAMKRIAPGLAALLIVTAHASQPPASQSPKVFRYAWQIAETTFDPQKIIDLYSNIANNAMFDTPLKYDYLARPLKLQPNTLTA